MWVFHLLSLSFTFFRIHDEHSQKPTAFHTKNYTKTASLSNGFLWPTLQYLQAFDFIFQSNNITHLLNPIAIYLPIERP